MSKQMPFFFDDIEEVAAELGASPCVILSLCCDRASANFRACAWLWAQIAAPRLGKVLLPHIEPCALHGVHLVKCRPSSCKAAVAGMSSLSALMRQWRFTSAMRDEIFKFVESRLHVELGPRPDSVTRRAVGAVDALFGSEHQ